MKKDWGVEFSKILYHHPKKLLLTGLVFIALLIPGAFNLKKDFSYRNLSSPSNPKLKNFDLFEKHFGNDDNVAVILYHPEGIFKPEHLAAFHKLEEDLKLIPETMRTESVFNGNTVTGTADAIEIKGLFPHYNFSQIAESEFVTIKQKAMQDEGIASYLLSPDATLTCIYLYLKPTTLIGQNGILNYGQAVDRIIAKHKSHFPEGSEILLSGAAYLSKTTMEVVRGDQLRLAPIILFFFATISLLTFRNVKGVLLILFMIAVNVICSLGVQAYLGIPVNGFTGSVGVIITTITTGAVIHVVNGFYRYYRKTGDAIGALMLTYQVNFIPTFLTSFTTSVGFFSLADKSLMPVYQLGIILGAGNMVSWIVIMLVIGPLIYLTHKQKNPPTLGENGLPTYSLEPDKAANQFSVKYIAFIFRHKKTILGIWLLALAYSAWYLPSLEVKMNPFTQFSPRLPISHTRDVIKAKMGYSMYLDLIIDTEAVDGAKKASLLKKFDAFEKELMEKQGIVKNVSLTTIIKSMHQTFNPELKTKEIPDNDETIAQYLLLYSFSDNGKLKNFITPDGRYLHSIIFSPKENSNQLLLQMDEIELMAKKHGLNLKVTGKMPLFMELGLVVFTVIGQSALISILLISLIMFLLVRDVKLGIISMIPNIVPVVIGAGIMKILGFGIDVGVTLVFSVCLGIAVDDTIHFIHHYRHLVKEGRSPAQALQLIVVNLFPMVVATTIILSVGFGVLGFADFLPNVKFGVLTSVILSVAMLADLFMLPSILLLGEKIEP